VIEDTTFEKHYSISQLSALWGYGRESIRRAIKDHPEVLKMRFGRKKKHVFYRVPASVARPFTRVS